MQNLVVEPTFVLLAGTAPLSAYPQDTVTQSSNTAPKSTTLLSQAASLLARSQYPQPTQHTYNWQHSVFHTSDARHFVPHVWLKLDG